MAIIKDKLISMIIMGVCLIMGSVGSFEAFIDKDYPQMSMGIFLIMMATVFAYDILSVDR